MSVFYKLDARVKQLFVLLFTLLVFLIDKLSVAVFLLLFIVIIRLASKIPFGRIKYFKNLTMLAVMIIILQMLFGPGNSYIVKPLFSPSFPLLGGIGSLKWEGLILGIVIVLRLSTLIIFLPIFTETTPAYKISESLCILGLNYRSAFIITSAFNFIPFFRDEALVIMDAQKLRGIHSFEKGSLFSKINAYAGIIVPLVLGAMRKAQVSSVAMDCRAFGVYKTRTWIDKPIIRKFDILFALGCIISFVCLLILNYI